MLALRPTMNPGKFFGELQRRNVYKAAAAYAVVAWLLIQIATQVSPFFDIPNWAVRFVVLLLVLGFPVALVLAWAFEITPDGVVRSETVAPGQSIARKTGRKLVGIIVLVAAMAAGLLTFRLLQNKAVAPAVAAPSVTAPLPMPEKSIAVLPFENFSAEKETAFFADGVQDDILTALAKVADLKVISRTSVLSYAPGSNHSLREIGQALGVAHVLEGSVRRARGKVRVTVQLIDTRTDEHLWADTYDRDLSDVFAMQTEIAVAVAGQLQARLSPREQTAIALQPTADIAAFDLYTRAKNLILTTSFTTNGPAIYKEAAELLNEAVAHDPMFFPAYCQLAYTHDNLYFLGNDHTPARLALAEAAIEAAFRLRPDAGEAHLARAVNLYRGYLSYDEALAELEIARRTLPNDSRVPEMTGYIVQRQGHVDEAIHHLERALELDPRNFYILQQIALSYQCMKRYPEMAAALDRGLAITPNDVVTKVVRASVALDARADAGPLHATIESILAKNPDSIQSVADIWFMCALAERDAAAAGRALTALGDNVISNDAVFFSRSFCEGVVARMAGDGIKAHAAFTAARTEQEKAVLAQPNYGPPLCVLGLIDAALGHKEEALREGRRAVAVLPVSSDSINGVHMIEYLGMIAAWVGEKALACEQLTVATRLPGQLSYGQLKLLPYWDALRGDPEFEKILAALGPKDPGTP